MIGVKHISQLSASGNVKPVPYKRVKLIDQIPEDVQLRIWNMYKGGVSRRDISLILVDEGVPSPKMTLPWGINAINKVIEKYEVVVDEDSVPST